MTKSAHFFDLLNDLLLEIKDLNELLLNDQEYFIKGTYEQIEQSAVGKLTIKNRIDAMMTQLNDQPEWNRLITSHFMNTNTSNSDLYHREFSLWKEINLEIKKNFALLDINHKVINENKAYYQYIFQCLANINPKEEANLIYDKKAKIGQL